MTNDEKIKILLTRGVEEIIIKEHLEESLKSGKKLRVKFGIDPTAPDFHLGHTVVLRKLRQFQNLGHKAVLIIGDFTAEIGDPSGRSEERKTLSESEVKKNMEGYLEQAGKIIDVKKAEVRYNGEWHTKRGLKKILELMRSTTIQQILKREDFQKRLSQDAEISLLETVYSLLQGYDSVAIEADVELGGTDQKLNLLAGRRVQRYYNVPEQDILIVPLIEGTDGIRKMSKGYSNYIGLTEKPKEMFGKIMSVPDNLLEKYFVTLTDIDIPKDKNPRDQKLLLAETIVGMYHSENDAKKTKEEFIRVFSKKEMPEEIPQLRIKNDVLGIVDLLIEAGVKSKSEARRLIKQGGVKIDDEIKKDPTETLNLKGGEILRIGKRRFCRITH